MEVEGGGGVVAIVCSRPARGQSSRSLQTIVLFRDYTGRKKFRPPICDQGAFDGFRRFGERCAPASERCWDIWKLLAVDASLVNVGVRVQTTQVSLARSLQHGRDGRITASAVNL